MSTLRVLAEATPTTRRRHVDLLRAVAILLVMLGHWLLMHVERTPAGLTGETALPELTDLHWLTWVFQVMPVFFLVGGVSNAISWTRHRARGGGAGDWLLGRSSRVFTPLSLLLVLMAVSAFAARLLGVSDYDIAQAVSAVVLPLWFLVVYFAVVLLTPAMFRLHQRFGLWVLAVALAGVVLGDVLRFATGIEYTAAANFAFAWLGIHQVGFAWFDGSLRLTVRRAWALVAGAFAALVLLTTAGPYPVSIVSVPGAEIQNSTPPSLVLVALAAVQVGLVVLVSGPAERWLRRPWAWAAVVGVNAVVMTLFLWHMVAGFFGAVALDALGLLPTAEPGTAAWWWGRVPWIGTLVLVMAVVIALVGRVETRGLSRRLGGARPVPAPADRTQPATDRTQPTTSRSASLPLVAGTYLAAILGMYWQNSAGRGPHGPFTVPTGALVLVLGAATLLWVLRRQSR